MFTQLRSHCWFIALILYLVPLRAQTPLDALYLGDAESERNHALVSTRSEILVGGLAEKARRLLPMEDENWAGGKIAFKLNVDPQGPNYFTIRLWGSDVNENRLILICDGKQIGYRHLGDIDILDHGSKEPAYNGRFYYATSPLPLELTKGKTQVAFEIRTTGRIWGYGSSFNEYQKPMTEPTRGIYSVYTHTDGAFTPPSREKQGEYPANPPVRKEPGPELLDQIKARINKELNDLLNKTSFTQQDAQFLARASQVAWTPAYRNPKVIEKVLSAGDDYYRAFRLDSKLAKDDPKQYNSGWFGVGPLANAIRHLPNAISPRLDDLIDDGAGQKITRRKAWGDLLEASRNVLRSTRRQYTNQTMIQDMNLYLTNRALAIVAPARALSETEARRYLYEAIGIQPWLGPDTPNGPSKPLGDNFYQLTAKGLTKELGYVGNYGEVLDWVTYIYLATAEPGRPETGDPKIRAQLVKLEHARAVFRYPMLDREGNRAMRLETIVGWRDSSYPGDVTYVERSAWEGSPIYSVAATLDARAVGGVQQMFADNQFFFSVSDLLKQGGLRVSNTLLSVPDDYARIQAQPGQRDRLPMTWTEPDFAWADEENGVLAFKRGGEVFYASLYWRARYAINNLARVHHITPRYDRIAVVRQESIFEDSGLVYRRPDTVNMGFGNGGFSYPKEWRSAHTGEELRIAKVPGDMNFKPGDENVHAGKAQFYTLRYGDYLIAMNTTTDRTFPLSRPAGVSTVKELMSGRTAVMADTISIGPRSTVVLYLGK